MARTRSDVYYCEACGARRRGENHEAGCSCNSTTVRFTRRVDAALGVLVLLEGEVDPYDLVAEPDRHPDTAHFSQHELALAAQYGVRWRRLSGLPPIPRRTT